MKWFFCVLEMSEKQEVQNIKQVKEVVIKPKRATRAKHDEVQKLCSELVDKEAIEVNESTHPQNEQNKDNQENKDNETKPKPTNDLQNKFDKNSVDDMKKLKALKDKIRRCEVQIKKYQEKHDELIKQLPQQ